MPVRLRLFGSPQLEVEQTMQDLPIERPISLGLYLAVRGDWVRRSELMYLYYPDAEESLAQSNLRKLLYRLKQRSWAAGLEAEPSRLRLVLASDVTDFRSAIAEKNYTRALELYKGAFLEGVQFPGLVGFDAWIELERSDLARIWRSALLEEVERLTAQNAYPEAERWLLRAWQQDPFDESVFQRILQVLHAAGQPARGLVLFAEFAAKLREQGMTPLESTIRLAQGLDANQGLAPKHNLPEFAARFFGRVSELERFKQWLYNPECRLITVVGLGGVGKTRFVIEALREQPSHFVDGVWFVPLVGVFSLELLISGIASAVGFAFSGATKTEVQLQNHLRAKEMLLFLDNFEQLTEHSSWLEGLLTNAPKLKIVVTSRLVLGLGSEWLFDLTGLSYPAIETKQPLESFEAVQLFLGQTARRSSRFTADQNTLGLIGDLTRQVQGLPLALEIVAAWTRSLGVEELLRGLLVQFETLLESDHEDVFARHRNLKTILESAWSLLSPNEQSVLVGLSVFSGSFSVAAAASIAKAHLGVLLHLQNLALIQRTLDGRFELHELVKQFVIPLEPKNYQACLEQKQKFFTTYLEQQNQNLRSSITPDTLRQCRLEVVNIVDVLEQNNGLFSDQAMLGFLAFVEMLGLFELGIACTQKILAQPHLALPTLGQCLALRANFGVKLGLDDLALQSAQACLEIGHNDLNWVFRGVAFYTLGIVQHFAANYPQALLEYHKALEVFAANYSHSEMARTHNRIAVIYSNLNQPQLSNSHYETALEMAKTANDLSEIGLIYNNYGINFESVGDIQKATALYTQALEICQSIGYLRGSSAALTNLGHLSERAGDYLSAKKYYEQSIIQKKEIGEPIALAISNTNLADVLYHLQMPQQANALNLQTLQSTLNANAYMYAARVVWSFCKHFRQQGQTLAAQTLAVFLLGIDCEEWVHEEASTLLAKQESKAIDQSKLEFSSLLDWLDTHLKM